MDDPESSLVKLIIEALELCKDTDLLDLIYRMLIEMNL